MPRPRTFDETQAIRAAVLVFWRHGYPSTGVRALCQAMDIQSGSFYATFQNKSSLFVRAIHQYGADMNLPTPSPAAARAYLDRIASDREPTGCLLALSAAELPSLSPDGQAAVIHQIQRVDRWLGACLRSHDSRHASVVTTFAWGLQTQHRAGVPVAALRQRVHHLVESLHLDEGPLRDDP